jgi:hypothetical protein
MSRFLNTVLLGAALIAPIVMVPTTFASHPEWNRHEDQAYRIWAKENQRRYNNNFAKAKESDQRANWGWRHEHSDTVLKIVIR